MNVYTKILAKIIAGRLQTVILNLVNADQTGFIPGRCAQMNVRRLFLNLQARHDNSWTGLLASLDTKKAFDSVEWPYLFHLLESYEFGPVFISWMKLLYTEPLVRLWVYGITSQTFPIFLGLDRGAHCLLSCSPWP